MLRSIYAPKLAEILPQSIRDDEKVHAAAVAIDSQLEEAALKAELVMHLPRLDELQGEVLDHLAYQFHCDFYRDDLPDEVKRNQIRESIFWHRIKGTPEGVERAISSFLADASVQENWDYDGEPYFFRITTQGLRYLSQEADFLSLINAAKNVRSWLDGITFDLTIHEPEIYYNAVAEAEGGKEETQVSLEDIFANEIDYHAIVEFEAGIEVTGCDYTSEYRNTYYAAFNETEGGYEATEALFFPEPDDFWLERWLLENWRQWQLNPAITPYLPPDEGEISPLDPATFPIDGNMLRLFFRFPDDSYKFLTLYNPREDLTAGEIRAVGVLSRDLFRNSRGVTSTGLSRAFYVTRQSYRIF